MARKCHNGDMRQLIDVPFSKMKETLESGYLTCVNNISHDERALSNFSNHVKLERGVSISLSATEWLAVRKSAVQCAICGKQFERMSQKCGDHNHETGKFRGVLCCTCNFAVGWMEKFLRSKTWAKKVVDYLRDSE
jgi:hypothetical protein